MPDNPPTPATVSAAVLTHDFSLPNGLRVILREDHRASVAACHLCYKVGSAQEPPGQSGMSHALEHLLYEGSSKLDAGQASRLLERLGAQENAYTSQDMTVFHQTLASHYLEVALEISADMMNDALLPDATFNREIEVIKAERSLRVDNDATSSAHELFQCVAYLMSSYRTPVIGWPADLERLSNAEVRHWYRQWYTPANATLVVVGDMHLAPFKAMVERHFAHLPTGTPVIHKRVQELPAPGERRIVIKRAQATPGLMLGINVPSRATSKDLRKINALRLLAVILSVGLSSRIVARLMRGTAILTSPLISYNANACGDTLVEFSASPKTGVSLEKLESDVWAQFEQMTTDLVSRQELDRARAQLFAAQVYARDSIQAQAEHLSELTLAGLPLSLLDSEQNDLLEITPQDLLEAARSWFTRDRLCIAHILPKDDSHE